MSDFEVERLLQTESLTIRHVRCHGTCRHRSAEECASATHLVFPYRGVYLRHVGQEQGVADANHVLFFNANVGYRVSHPVEGGDRSLVLALDEHCLEELAPARMLAAGTPLRFRPLQQRIDPRAQALVSLLRHRLVGGSVEPLEAQGLALALVARSLGPRTSHPVRATPARRRRVDRVKLLLASDLSRRWTLGQIASEVGGSPVALTQAFRQVEGLPLYRYHLQLRLARALDRVPRHDDFAGLGADLGFSSHSHFSAAFRRAYGLTPSEFRRSTGR